MKRSLVIFYFLLLYALAELTWWGILIIRIQPNKKSMILGEGAIFILLLCIGAYQLHKTLRKEAKLHDQQKNFLLSVTHELKSPLASIKLYLETILKRDLEKEKLHGFLKNSLKDIERLDDLVENMLIATKIENKSYSFPKEEFDLSELVSRIAGRLQGHICNTQTIQATVQPNIKLVGDRFALTSVVTNLIENAVKYSPKCAAVWVNLKQSADVITLEVADAGIGIHDDEKLRIFDKFYRVGSEDTRKTKGTGLGLYIVRQVLNNHEAQIKVRNNKPSGSIFEVTFNSHA